MAPRQLGLTLALLAVAAIGAVIVLSAGHGKGPPLSPDRYRKELATAFAGMRLDTNATEGDALNDLAGELGDLGERLDELVPPADAAPAHARLVAGLKEYADQLEALADAGRRGAIEFQQQLAETGGLPGQAWVDAFNDLAARGYVTAQPR
jgi:hypothetical protein